MNKTLSSPNAIIWEYFKGLRRIVGGISTHNQEEQKQEIALSIFLSVTIVEAFLNIYFRIIVDETDYLQHREKFLEDLDTRKSLDYKIKNWPQNILGQKIDFNSGIGKDFMDLKEKRNKLMHFNSTHEHAQVENILILGLTDISIYERLSLNDALFALQTAEGILEAIFRCKGINEDKMPQMIHVWTGKVPV